MFGKNENSVKKAAWEVYADKYIEGIEKLHTIGGFQLVTFSIGVVLIFLSGFLATTNGEIGHSQPYLVVAGAAISVCGIALHVSEVRRKERAFQKSLDNYYNMTSELWKLYVHNLSKREAIDSSTIIKSLEELNKIIQSNQIT